MADYPRRALDVRSRTARGQTYVARGQVVFELTEVAARIWQLADGSRTIAEIGSLVAAEYDVDAQTAEADASAFIGELRQAGFVEQV